MGGFDPLQRRRVAGTSTAVTRICATDGSTVGENQRGPLQAALEGMTIVAAAQCGLGAKTGSLKPGKYADLVLLESNPLNTDPAKLGDIKVSQTWVGGKRVQARPVSS